MGIVTSKLGAVLKAHRVVQGWSLREVAQRMHRGRQTIHRWEAGTCTPSLSALHELAHLYGTTVAALIDPENAKKKPRACAA